MDKLILEIDYIGVFFDFKSLRECDLILLEKFLQEHNVDINSIQLNYVAPTYLELQKYGYHDKLDLAQWFNTHGHSNTNFHKGTDLIARKDYVDLANFTMNTKSIAIMLGDLNEDLNYVMNHLTAVKIPVIKLNTKNQHPNHE